VRTSYKPTARDIYVIITETVRGVVLTGKHETVLAIREES
jgi:hypothetical protein